MPWQILSLPKNHTRDSTISFFLIISQGDAYSFREWEERETEGQKH